MLKAEELRIRNIVRDKRSKQEEVINELSIDGYNAYNSYGEQVKFYLEDIDGVPLTEGWLLRMGFTIVPAPSAYGFDCNNWSEKYLLRGAWNGKSWFAYEILNNGTHKEIRFVHELQNLYRALAGTELTIKE